MSKRVLVHVILCLVPVAGACYTVDEPSYPDISGTWAYSVSGLSGGGLWCTLHNVTLVLEQTDGTFTGSFTGPEMNCLVSGVWSVEQLAPGAVVNGVVTESGDVFFDFDTSDYRHSGTLTGYSMVGTVAMRLGTGAETQWATGSWAAYR